jgi:hypothetical protein
MPYLYLVFHRGKFVTAVPTLVDAYFYVAAQCIMSEPMALSQFQIGTEIENGYTLYNPEDLGYLLDTDGE